MRAFISKVLGWAILLLAKDGWIQLHSGRKFYYFDKDRSDTITIDDIAHSLSMQCRFNGHIDEFYSVAQHSVEVSMHVCIENRIHGLLHDAAETFIGDLVSPFKGILKPLVRPIEALIMARIYSDLVIEPPSLDAQKEVRLVDLRMLVAEKHALHAYPMRYMWECEKLEESFSNIVIPAAQCQEEAKESFMSRYMEVRYGIYPEQG